MPSARYYREQAKALLSWARATKDSGYADRLRARAAEELEQAELAREAVADLTPLPMEFNSQRLNSRVHQQGTRMPCPEPVRALQDLLAVIGSPDEIAPMDTLHFGRKLADVITGACTRGRSRSLPKQNEHAVATVEVARRARCMAEAGVTCIPIPVQHGVKQDATGLATTLLSQ